MNGLWKFGDKLRWFIRQSAQPSVFISIYNPATTKIFVHLSMYLLVFTQLNWLYIACKQLYQLTNLLRFYQAVGQNFWIYCITLLDYFAKNAQYVEIYWQVNVINWRLDTNLCRCFMILFEFDISSICRWKICINAGLCA